MIGDILYNIVIAPIEMIVEFIFSVVYKISQNPGVSILGVSLVINFLVLPLYKKSDDLQEVEREKQKQMKPWLDHIKNNFKGDERYLMTQAYYRQQGYKPIYALRSSISLLLQIPFFIAAFHFLSNLALLKGASFLILPNLGEPDGLIKIGSLSLNLLPILMTAINIISGAIYTRGFPIKEKLQLYGMALIFLVLLYNSPSGLVFYWTLNNVFSLCKNVVMKVLPHREKKAKPEVSVIDKKFFFIGAAFMAIFTGLVIPLSILSASPLEFISTNYGPVFLAINTLSVTAGFFLLWLGVFYYLASNRGKNFFIYAIWILAGISIVNFYFFGNNYGNISTYLVYDSIPSAEMSTILLNFGVCVAVGAAFALILKFSKKIAKSVCSILVIAALGFSIVNIFTVSGAVDAQEEKVDAQNASNEKILKLSKNNENVIVFMLDRAIGAYLPRILEEFPEYEEKLDGFTFYPNTLSYAKFTNFSTPSLFGGYEYTPLEINKRSNETILDKHNEALSVLPVLFANNDYASTVCDAPYIGDYSWTGDPSYYDQFDGVKGYNTIGKYNDTMEISSTYEPTQKRNFVCYSIFRCLPTGLGLKFYDYGNYFSTSSYTEETISKAFIDSYAVLKNLNNITDTDSSGRNFIMIQNSSTHEVTELDENYEVNQFYKNENSTYEGKQYDVHVAALRELCVWFDYLKEQGVYDNTKIIICSDHGAQYGEFDEMLFKDIDLDVESFNPLLLVKEAHTTGFTIDTTLMTTADVATLATTDSIDYAINPFTGNNINSDAKSEPIYITDSWNWDTDTNNGNVFDTSDDAWFKFFGNSIINRNAWERIDEPKAN